MINYIFYVIITNIELYIKYSNYILNISAIERHKQLQLSKVICCGCIVAISCGFGFYETSKKHYKLLKGIGIDLISLCPFPPHYVPLIITKYDIQMKNIEYKLINWIKHNFYDLTSFSLDDFFTANLPSPFTASSAHTHSLQTGIAKTKECEIMAEYLPKENYPFIHLDVKTKSINFQKNNKSSSLIFWNRWAHVVLPSTSFDIFEFKDAYLPVDNLVNIKYASEDIGTSIKCYQLNWTPLISPALLPITCDFNSLEDQIENDYLVSFYELFVGDRIKSITIVNEMTVQRIDMGFQKVQNGTNIFIDQKKCENYDAHIVLTNYGGKIIHVLIAHLEYVSVKIYQQKKANPDDIFYSYKYTRIMLEYNDISNMVETTFCFDKFESTSFFNNMDRFIVSEHINNDFDGNNQVNNNSIEIVVTNQLTDIFLTDFGGNIHFNPNYRANLVEFINKLNQTNFNFLKDIQFTSINSIYQTLENYIRKRDLTKGISNYFISFDLVETINKQLNYPRKQIIKLLDELVTNGQLIPVNNQINRFVDGFYVFYLKPKRKLIGQIIEVEFVDSPLIDRMLDATIDYKKSKSIEMNNPVNNQINNQLGIIEMEPNDVKKTSNEIRTATDLSSVRQIEFSPVVNDKSFFQFMLSWPLTTTANATNFYSNKTNYLNQLALSCGLKLLHLCLYNHQESTNHHHAFYFKEILKFDKSILIEFISDKDDDGLLSFSDRFSNDYYIEKFVENICLISSVDYLYNNNFRLLSSENRSILVHEYGLLIVEIEIKGKSMVVYIYDPYQLSINQTTEMCTSDKYNQLMITEFHRIWAFMKPQNIISYFKHKYPDKFDDFLNAI